MSRLHLDAAAIEREVSDLLAAYPELADDEALKADAIEGQTGAHEFLSRVVRAMRSEEALATATKEAAAKLAAEMKAREDAAQRRADGLRALAYRIIKAAKPNGPVRLPEATLSIAAVPPKLVIDDENQVPENCYLPVVTKKLNREVIKALFANGRSVPGCRMSEPSDRLNVRVA